MRSLLAIGVALAAAGCVDSSTCHNPIAWKPCAGATAEPGASGSPPSIVSLTLPTCAYLASPTALGSIAITDPDGDAQLVKATFFTGVRNNESEQNLDDAYRNGNDWSGAMSIVIVGASGGKVMEGSDDVRIKVTDRAGAQSVPYCNTIAVVP